MNQHRKMDRTTQAVAIFDKLAEGYQQKFMDVSMYHEILDHFCEHLQVAYPEILDVACGPGNVTKYLLSKQPGLKILGTDLSPRMLELAKENNPTAEFQLMDSRKIRDLEKKMDGIICSFCLPYLSKEEAIQFIKDASQVLKPGGLLYISTMEDDNGKSKMEKSSSGDEMFMNYHEAGYLTDALNEEGLGILLQQRKTYSYNNKQTTDLLILAVKSVK